MDISTINTIIASTATFIGAAVLFVLGAILQYVRSINSTMKEIGTQTIEHKMKIDQHDEWLKLLDDKIYKLNRA